MMNLSGKESRLRLVLLNLALALGAFIEVLDFSIANVSLPHIAGSFSITPTDGVWIITSYGASNAIVLPLTGWLSDRFGKARLFSFAVAGFAVSSFICGCATSFPMLVTARCVQGLMAGNLMPLSHGLLMECNPPERRNIALGLWGTIVVCAPVLGPIIGGYITEFYSWPWIFYINVPIGFICSYFVWTLAQHPRGNQERQPIDWIGLLLLVLAVGCAQLLLDLGRELNWFQSELILQLTIISIVSCAYFLVWTPFSRNPVVDLKLFTNRNFLVGTLVMTIGYTLFFGPAVVLPIWIQTQLGLSAFLAGTATAPIGIGSILFTGPISLILHRYDVRWLVSLSFLLFALSFLVQSRFTTETSLEQIQITRLLQGAAVGLFFVPLVQLATAQIPNEKLTGASGVFNFFRILFGSGFGASVFVQLWINGGGAYYFQLAEAMTPTNPHNALTGAWPLPEASLAVYQSLALQQGYTLSLNSISIGVAFLYLLLVPMPFLCKRVTVRRVADEAL